MDFRALIISLAFIHLTFGQDVSGLPACGQYCVQNAASNATAGANCNVNHANCYCSRANFDQNVKACANTTCTTDSDKAVVAAFADGYCGDQSTGGTATGGGGGTSSTSSSTSSATAITMSTTVTAASSTASPSSNPSNSGLSTGAKVGIGVGVPLGVIAIAGVWFLFWLRRRRQQQRSQGAYEERPKVASIHEVDGVEKPAEMGVPIEKKEVPPPPPPAPPPVYELPVARRSDETPGNL